MDTRYAGARARYSRAMLTFACVALTVDFFVPSALSAPSAGKDYTLKTIATGLDGPRGMAWHPFSKDLYVAETSANRVSIIRDGVTQPALAENWTVANNIPQWAVSEDITIDALREPVLHRPHAIAFSRNGTLFISEAAKPHRLLEFAPDSNGVYARGEVIPIPWLKRAYTWKGITPAADGRLYIAGYAEDSGPGLHFGSVLMRDPKGEWWVVDYGPFTGFSSAAISRYQDILVVGDHTTGDVTWWDAMRRKVIGHSSDYLHAVEDVALLPDGQVAVAHERDSEQPARGHDGLITVVNPETELSAVAAKGFGRIGKLVSVPESGALLVAEPEAGTIHELRMKKEPPPSEYYLRRSLYTFEMSEGLAPRKWPPFMKDFVSRLGVRPADADEQDGADPDALSLEYTVREFTDQIPLIAGRVNVVDRNLSGDLLADPVKQIDFVVFFPGQSVMGSAQATPSLSLFSALHESGRVEKTRVIPGMQSSRLSRKGGWTHSTEKAQVYLPITACNAKRTSTGMDLTLSFMGLGETEDYFLELHCGRNDGGRLVINGMNGQMSAFDVEFTEMRDDGEEIRNVVAAGLEPEEEDPYTWLRLGTTPVQNQLQFETSQKKGWVPYRMAALKPMLEEKSAQWEVAELRRDEERAAEAFREERNAQRGGPTRADSDRDREALAEPDSQYSDVPQDEAQSITNLILTRAISAWKEKSF